MTTIYPCSFEQAAQKTLEEMLPQAAPGSFRKVKVLAEAIHGKVKLVESRLPNMPKPLVVKQIPKGRASVANRQPECPRNEIHASLAMKGLRVPNVAETLFAAQDEKHFYLASEYCPNGELLDVINKQGRIQDDALLREVLCQILVGVRGLHQAGVAHRDLSLENVLVAADGSLKIIDFAQAVMVHGPGDALGEVCVSQEFGPPGKPLYQGPELAGGAPYLATKVDTFAIGVMLFAMISGGYPFNPNSQDPTRVNLFPAGEMELGRCTRLRLQLQKTNKNLLEQISPGCLDMMEQLMAPNPKLRLSVEEALMHPWITGAVSGLWHAIDDEDNMEDTSTNCTGDTDTMTDCSDSISFGNHMD